ncbi:MAG TPA: hypothetical protein VLJ11_08780 [Bryobacteraceae bacterium]|nr:hypothetical protein [Bryobacteraceae bacterium]
MEELKARNPGYETAFKRIDATMFSAAIYRTGSALARCQIRLGGMMGNGISFSYGNAPYENSLNESRLSKPENRHSACVL